MALVTCHECGHQISQAAAACPSCGAQPKKPTSRAVIGIAGLALVFVLYGVFSDEGSRSAIAPPDPAAGREFQQVVGAIGLIRNNLKNPASFELVSATMAPGRALCVVYRGTNSFNATITSHQVVTDTVNSAGADAWRRHCAGQTGTNYIHARHALR